MFYVPSIQATTKQVADVFNTGWCNFHGGPFVHPSASIIKIPAQSVLIACGR